MIAFRTSLAAMPAVPWANGRGTTRELLRREDAAGRLLLRLSVADVVEPGPFSKLPGIDRVLTLIEGPGFDLSIDGREVPVRLLEPVRFSGDADVAAIRVPGPSRDFNVMSAAGAGVSVGVRRETFVLGGSPTILFIVAGEFQVGDTGLSSGWVYEMACRPGETIVVAGRGAMIVIETTIATG